MESAAGEGLAQIQVDSPGVAAEIGWMLRQARAARRRTMREFAEQEIIIPDGPYEGRRFRCDRQPYSRLWFDLVDSGNWSRHVATGPSQSGKSLSCFVTPILYHLFEIGETVICGLPDMDMAGDKWREDLKPVIDASRYRDYLPRTGGGSRGGKVESIQFTNGATLKFMSGGGSDKSRAGFTSRVVVVTETDGMDEASVTSREADPITQLEARTRAYGSRKRIYLECTVSTEEGRTWREYSAGTGSRIIVPCPACNDWVSPEREHLRGYQESPTKIDAQHAGHFVCASCGAAWSHDQRVEMNRQARVLHSGQAIEAGEIVGPLPKTDTLGFRWSGFNNLFATASELAGDEWRASQSEDQESASREMMQFVWAVPVPPAAQANVELDTRQLAERTIDVPRGVVPGWATVLTAAIDLGHYVCHWVIMACSDDGLYHLVDYGRLDVASKEFGLERATLQTLREFRDSIVLPGFPVVSPDSEDKMVPLLGLIDSGDGGVTDVVYSFCHESQAMDPDGLTRFRPAVGRGAGQQAREQRYNRPTSTGSICKYVGEDLHINLQPEAKISLVIINSDRWKSWVHQRLRTPIGNTGSLTLFRAPPNEHLQIARHWTAESRFEEFVSGKGVIIRWKRIRKQNHWLDATYNAGAASSICGVSLLPGSEPDVSEPTDARGEPHRPAHNLDDLRDTYLA